MNKPDKVVLAEVPESNHSQVGIEDEYFAHYILFKD